MIDQGLGSVDIEDAGLVMKILSLLLWIALLCTCSGTKGSAQNVCDAWTKEYSTIFSEVLFSDNKNDRKALCVSACMGVDLFNRSRAQLEQCAREGKPEQKEWARTFLEKIDTNLSAMKRIADGACQAACPSSLPRIERTAGGVAASLRLRKLGDPSAYDVKTAYVVVFKQFGKNLEKKPLAFYEEETYKCVYDNIDIVYALWKKESWTQEKGLVSSLGFCLDNDVRKKFGSAPDSDAWPASIG
jgi:hypothetical protein